MGVYGVTAPAVGDVPSVILFTPADGATVPSRLGEPIVDQFGLTFSPRRLLVEAGTTVRFTNSEAALAHNVQLTDASGEVLLDDDATPGASLEVTLPDEGPYGVSCEMHPGMTAFVFATEAPLAVIAEPDGSWSMPTLPPGAWSARVWTAASGIGEAVEFTFDGVPIQVALGDATENPD